jgi:hypothetical protein
MLGWGKKKSGKRERMLFPFPTFLRIYSCLRNSFFYHTKVPTAPWASDVETDLPLKLMLKFWSDPASFSTINTFLPSGVLNATFGKLAGKLVSIRTEPGRTNLDA